MAKLPSNFTLAAFNNGKGGTIPEINAQNKVAGAAGNVINPSTGKIDTAQDMLALNGFTKNILAKAPDSKQQTDVTQFNDDLGLLIKAGDTNDAKKYYPILPGSVDQPLAANMNSVFKNADGSTMFNTNGSQTPGQELP